MCSLRTAENGVGRGTKLGTASWPGNSTCFVQMIVKCRVMVLLTSTSMVSGTKQVPNTYALSEEVTEVK